MVRQGIQMGRLISFGSSPLLPHGGFKPTDLTLPGTIASKLAIDHISCAKPISSNNKISRKILSYEYMPGDVVLVAWTSTTRFEFRTEHGWTGINPATYRAEHSFGEHWYNGPGQWEYTAILIALKEILITQTFLKESDIQYIFIFDNNELLNSWLIKNPDTYLSTIIKLIDWDKFINFDGEGFMPWCRTMQFEFNETHPNPLAHQQAAEYILERSTVVVK